MHDYVITGLLCQSYIARSSSLVNLFKMYYFNFYRFGMIVAMRSKVEIREGEEIFISYGFPFDVAPDWYKDLFLQFMLDHPGG